MKRKTSAIDVIDGGKQSGDNRFKRLEYWGTGSIYLVHYFGDQAIYKPFSHRNSKQYSCRSFLRSAPHIKDKVSNFMLIMYHNIVHSYVCIC